MVIAVPNSAVAVEVTGKRKIVLFAFDQFDMAVARQDSIAQMHVVNLEIPDCSMVCPYMSLKLLLALMLQGLHVVKGVPTTVMVI